MFPLLGINESRYAVENSFRKIIAVGSVYPYLLEEPHEPSSIVGLLDAGLIITHFHSANGIMVRLCFDSVEKTFPILDMESISVYCLTHQ